jgi:hypothetical protein
MMGDRLHFRSFVIASLCARNLSLAVAMGVLGDRDDDLYETGLPADDAADLVYRELKCERRFAPVGV